MTEKSSLIGQIPMRKRSNLDMNLSKPTAECAIISSGNPKESRSENSVTMKNSHQLSSGSYESMRLLIERQERDLGELREFANIERESLQFHVLEQQERINTFLKIQSETQLSDKENRQTQNRGLSHNNRGGSQNKENSCPNVGDGSFQLLKIQLAQCQADLKFIKDSSHQDENPTERLCLQNLRTQSAREVLIMDSIL